MRFVLGWLGLCLSLSAFAQQASFTFQSSLDCTYLGKGCPSHASPTVYDVSQYKGPYERLQEKLYACQGKPQGCTVEEQDKIDRFEIQKRAWTPTQFQEFVRKDPQFIQKSYFIPLPLTDREILVFAATTSLGLVLFEQDQEITNFIQENKTEMTDQVASLGNLFGASAVAPVALGSYFLGAVFKDGKLKQLGLLTVSSGLATLVVTEAFKKTFNRLRPDEELGPYEFFQPGQGSFISGTTAAAFSFATVVSEVYKDIKWVPYIAYGLATVTAYSRLYDKKSWASDVLAGAIMGHLLTKATIRLQKRVAPTGGLKVYPSIDFDTKAIYLNIEYVEKKPRDDDFFCKILPPGEERIQACIEEAYVRSASFF